jgi:hypothetical protein
MNVLYEQVTLGPPSNLPWGDDFKTVIYLSHQKKTSVRSGRGAHKIYHDGPVKMRPDHPFPAFTTTVHLGDPQFAKYTSLYHMFR